LDLTRNTIKGDGGVAIGRMLTVNSGIRQLTLSENAVSVEGAQAIGLALPSNMSLQILNLRKCGLCPKGARFIAQGLNTNHAVLRELSVGMNNVMDEGAAEFADMIMINRSLKEFYLDDNGIRGFGAVLIAEALRNNDWLETFWMVNNYLKADVVARFVLTVAENKSLRQLGIACADELPPDVLQSLQQIRQNMAERKHERSVHDNCQVARLRSPGPREAREKGVQEIIVWDDGLQVEELLEMSRQCESNNLQREVHASKGIAPVDLSDGVDVESVYG
jgi:hypothetical protein